MHRTLPWTMGVLLAACWTATSAQDRLDNQFDVATVKPHDPNSPIGFSVQVYPGGRVLISAMPLKSLVSTAFRHTDAQIDNKGERWIESDRYTIEAKAAANSGVTNFNHTLFDIEDERLRGMLQALLIDRFSLRVHRETRTGDLYQLTRTSKPLALQLAKLPEGRDPRSMYSNIGYVGGRWSMQFMTMAQLAKFASTTVVRAPVADQTNLTGSFDYKQPVPDQEPKYTGIEHTDSFLRMLGDVGLALKRSRGPVEWLVIDGATRPTPD